MRRYNLINSVVDGSHRRSDSFPPNGWSAKRMRGKDADVQLHEPAEAVQGAETT